MMRKSRRLTIGTMLAAVSITGYYLVHHLAEEAVFLNFAVVEPGRLLRSAQPRPGDLDRLLAETGLRTILCLRGKETTEVSLWAREHDVKVIMMKMRADDPPTDGQIGLFFDVMRGETVDLKQYQSEVFRVIGVPPNAEVKFELPLLLHCEGGADRTGVMTALYRMAFQGWSVEAAMEEMKAHYHFPSRHPAQFVFLQKIAADIHPAYGSKSRMVSEASSSEP